jgi:hypothetical protein
MRHPGDEYHGVMRRGLLPALTLALGASGAALLGGCGSGTRTVSVAGAPPPSQTSGTGADRSPTTTATSQPRSTTQPSGNGGTTASTTTRTAAEPAFAQAEARDEGLAGATAVLRAKGFTPNDTSDYHPNQTLRVLVGTRSGSGDGHGQQAFFFVDGRYIGTDAIEPSATVRVVAQGDTEVTLAYPLYRSGDPLCCPGGGEARVPFQLDNGRLMPLQAIPPASSNTGLSRQ